MKALLLILCSIVVACNGGGSEPSQSEPKDKDLENAFFVATNGDDENVGSFTKPWKTIAFGVSGLKAGDHLFIREGIYKETIIIEGLHGEETHPITISGYEDERPIVDGKGLVPSLWEPLVDIKDAQHLFLEQVEIRNSRGTGIRTNGEVHHLVFRDIWMHFTGYDGIQMENSNFMTVEDSRFWDTNIVNDITGDWYEEHNWGGAILASGDPDIGLPPAHDIRILNNEIYQSYGEGINIFGHLKGALIEGNTFVDCWAPCVFTPNSEGVVINRNLVYQTNDTRFLRDGQPGAGIAFQNEQAPDTTRPGAVRDIVVTNNLVFGCSNNLAFWHDGSVDSIENILVAHNTFVDAKANDNDGSSVFIVDAEYKNIRIENNIFLQESSKGDFGYSAALEGVIFSHNLWYPGLPPENMRSEDDVYEDPLLSRTGSTLASELKSSYFQIGEASPAKHAAKYLDDVRKDFEGLRRDAQPTIGAFE